MGCAKVDGNRLLALKKTKLTDDRVGRVQWGGGGGWGERRGKEPCLQKYHSTSRSIMVKRSGSM